MIKIELRKVKCFAHVRVRVRVRAYIREPLEFGITTEKHYRQNRMGCVEPEDAAAMIELQPANGRIQSLSTSAHERSERRWIG